MALHLEGPQQVGSGALLPRMPAALTQENNSQSQRRPEVGQKLGDKTVSPTFKDFQIKGIAEDRLWFQVRWEPRPPMPKAWGPAYKVEVLG